MDYQDVNAGTISRWIKEDGWKWGVPVDSSVCSDVRKGIWDVFLTPVKTVPHSWFPQSLEGVRILGLASGGGQQIPVFSLLGAICTVLDYDDDQLDAERMVARREGYDADIVKADMSKSLPFEDESFDMIFNPPSLCYIEKVEPLFLECSRVLKKGGVMMTALESAVNYISDPDDESRIVHSLPFNPLKNPGLYREKDGFQFSHSFSEQTGGLLSAGFTLTDVYEDTNGYGLLHELNIPSFMAVRTVKK